MSAPRIPFRTATALVALAFPNLLLAAAATDPVGPAGWSLRNWIGLALQIGLFLGALWVLSRLAASAGPAEEGQAENGVRHDD
jgi:hypothetical protein